MELKDWILAFVKSRDAFHRTLQEHTITGDEITFTHKHKVHHFLLSPELKVVSGRDWYTVVCLNTPENVQFLVDHWDEFLQDKMTILFVNLGQQLYWQINPQLHHSVADPESLQQGIETMASEVPYV